MDIPALVSSASRAVSFALKSPISAMASTPVNNSSSAAGTTSLANIGSSSSSETSRGNTIALGVGLGIGLPALLIAVATW